MAPRVSANQPGSTNSFQSSISRMESTPTEGDFSIGNSAFGVGQLFSVKHEFSLPQLTAPKAALFSAWLPRIGGAAVTLLTSGSDLYNTFRSDQASNEPTLKNTRRQFFSSAASITAGFGVGTLAGGSASVALAIGAPVSVGVGISALGVGGALFASKYAYDWASQRADQWIPY